MKKRGLIAVLLASAMLFGACGKTEETEPVEQTTATTQSNTMIITVNESEGDEEAGETEASGPVELTVDNYFTTDPADTEWGQGDGAGIIDLVDLGFIEDSMDGVFEVDTIAQFASLNYFVNTYPLPRVVEDLSDDHFFIHVNINSDFDLSSYDWPSLGHDSADHEYAFSGIIIGNGHTISGLDHNRSFFGDIYGSTVCGFNFDEGLIGVNDEALIVDTNLEDVRFFDCHITGEYEDEIVDAGYLFIIQSTEVVNRYLDCSVDVLTTDGEVYSEDIELNAYSTGANNAVMEFFDPDHDGTYEYGENFFDTW